MSEDENVELVVSADPGTVHGQRYLGVCKRSKYLKTENIEKVWNLVDDLDRQQREERKNA